MTFDIFIKAKVLDDLPQSRKKQVAEALKDLKNGFQGGNKCRIENAIVVFDILTQEQAHKKYGRL